MSDALWTRPFVGIQSRAEVELANVVPQETLAMSRRREAGESDLDADALLRKVHERTGLGIDIQTFSEGTVEVRWKRDFDGSWSEERSASAVSISEALQAVLEYETEADTIDAREAGGQP